MRNLALCGLFLALAVPAFAQSSTPAPVTQAPAVTATDPDTANYTTLRETLAVRNKQLTDDVNTQRALVKRNQDLLKEAQRLDAANKKLEAEKVRLQGQNSELQKQREALKASQPLTPSAPGSDVQTASIGTAPAN